MEAGKIYHIYNRGNNKENIFLSEQNYLFFLKKYKQYLSPVLDTYAYCLMPNHFHFLIRVKKYESDTKTSEVFKTSEVSAKLLPIEKRFKDFFICYAKAFNKSYNRTGSLFQSKYKKKEINNDSYYSSIIAYIHLNPVKANICTNAEKWKFSSYNAYINSKPTSLLRDEVIGWFGDVERLKYFHLNYREDPSLKEYLID